MFIFCCQKFSQKKVNEIKVQYQRGLVLLVAYLAVDRRHPLNLFVYQTTGGNKDQYFIMGR